MKKKTFMLDYYRTQGTLTQQEIIMKLFRDGVQIIPVMAF